MPSDLYTAYANYQKSAAAAAKKPAGKPKNTAPKKSTGSAPKKSTGSAPKKSTGSGHGSGSSDAVTPAQKKAKANLGVLRDYNINLTKNQLNDAIDRYNTADKQIRSLTETEDKQATTAADDSRFAQQKKLQMSAQSVTSAAGNALQGSQSSQLAGMLKARQDLDNGEALSTLTSNRNTLYNTLRESLDENARSRAEARSDAEFAIGGIKADYAKELNNINPKLFKKPGAKKGITKKTTTKKTTPKKTTPKKTTPKKTSAKK